MKIKNIINNLSSVPAHFYFGRRSRMHLTIIITLLALVFIHPSPPNDYRMTTLNNQLLSNPSEWIICGPTSWQDLKNYLPEAKLNGISVSVMLLPPFQSTNICSQSSYSEPYGNDYIHWAQEIALLSLRYSNLTQFGIYELRENLNLGYLRHTYIDSVITASKSLNPRMQFISPHKNFYVDRDATGNGNGTSWANAANKLSLLNWALIAGGDTIYISGGTDSTTYFSDLLSNKNIVGGYVVITKGIDTGHDGNVYFVSTGGLGERYTLWSNNCSYLKFDRLNFIWNTDIVDSTLSYACFHIRDSDHIWLSRCNITTNGRAFPSTVGTSTSLSYTDNNMEVLTNNYETGQDILQIVNGGGGHVITGNKMILGGLNNSPTAAHHDHIQIVREGSSNNLETVIANNLFYFNKDAVAANCISVQEPYTSRYLIYNNIISLHSKGMGGIYCGSGSSSYDVSLRIFNNSIITERTTGNNDVAVTIGESGYPDTLIIRNNIMVNDYAEMLGIYTPLSSINYLDVDFNYYDSVDRAGLLIYANSSYLNFAQWQALGHDANSTVNSTTFIDIKGLDLADYITESGRNLGVSLSSYFTTDILGNPRTGTWDMGAIEQ